MPENDLCAIDLSDLMTYCPLCLTKSVLGNRCLNKWHESTLTARDAAQSVADEILHASN